MSNQPIAADPIAIIGMACRFPGAGNYREFWESLRRGDFCVREIPEDRWNKDDYYSTNPEEKNKSISKWGGFIDGVDQFDASVFKISPREAELMDPQQRIMLELTWSCMEDAGYAPADFRGSATGVYFGVCNFDYKEILERSLPAVEGHLSTGSYISLIPNRVSYEFDLKGPSMPIDTACSSSLVALNEAVHALRRGDCAAAFVGGISILCSPTYFVAFSKTGMLSPDGVCKTFDESANGYVRGEGAGVILLKPLQQALRDNDLIHGVIKGVSVNHGGRFATVTSPNPFAQSQVIVDAFKKSGLPPTSVNYIEAHGTGTPKGDPIEINALKRAFSSLEQAFGVSCAPGSCGIGSAKTNIGHLEAAAGMAGIIKVLLSMKHGFLPGLLHFKKLNPRINLKESPFYIANEPREWMPAGDGLRRAGVSSFGFGGVNAHVLLEEYPVPTAMPAVGTASDAPTPLLFVLSAKDRECLNAYAKSVSVHLDSFPEENSDATFVDSFLYTLQRRQALDERLALVASSFAELKKKLKDAVEGKTAEGIYRGNAKDGQQLVEFLGANDDMSAVFRNWIVERQVGRVARLWVKGFDVDDWDAYYVNSAAGKPPSRQRLPTYPFSRKRYWIEGTRHIGQPVNGVQELLKPAAENRLHPLLHRNTSTLAEQRFSSRFTGDEFFLNDHRVNGRKVLPGVAYLEMVRAAMECASDDFPSFHGTCVQLRNVVWIRSVAVGDRPVDVHVALHPEDARDASDAYVSYEVYTGTRNADSTFALHSQGKARWMSDDGASALDLPALQERMSKNGDIASYYDVFARMGIDYGPAHRALDRVYTGEPGRREALAKLVLPSVVTATRTEFVLHPSLLDAALQACLAIGLDGQPSNAPLLPLLPFGIESLQIVAIGTEDGPQNMWAWIRPSRHDASTGDSFEARMAAPFDIDLCDDQGRVHVRIRGFSMRVLDTVPLVTASPVRAADPLMLKPIWKGRSFADSNAGREPIVRNHRVVFAGFQNGVDVQSWIRELRGQCAEEASSIVFMDLGAGALALREPLGELSPGRRFMADATALFEMLQGEVRASAASKDRTLVQVVVPAAGPQQVYVALSGLLKTVQLENPRIIGQMMVVSGNESADRLLADLRTSSTLSQVPLFRYEGERCWIGSWEEMAHPRPDGLEQMPWKERGVYLITGGMGGLGRILVREIAERVKDVTLVLTGRSDIDRRRIDALLPSHPGVNVEYRALDVCDARAVDALVRDIRTRYGALHGILHCAGVLHDNYLIKKTTAEFERVLAPKIDGVIHLDEATRDLPLDFFVLFSSTSGVFGNVGQADYAVANAYLDAFAHYRNSLGSQRRGRTLSINWPLWRHGGMEVDAATERMLQERTGMVALETSAGIRAFYRALASDECQTIVIDGDADRIRRKLLSASEPVRQPEPMPVAAPSGEGAERVQDTLLQIGSKILKLQSSDLDVKTKLSEFGFDSITFTEFANRISEKYGIELAPTAFFDHPTIAALATHLWEEHGGKIGTEHPAVEASTVDASLSERRAETSAPTVEMRETPHYARTFLARQSRESLEPQPRQAQRRGSIAVVGMSGRFPMAKNVAEFWCNLKSGRNCIGEIPKRRWDWKALYGDPATEANKTNIKWGGFIDGVDEFDPLFFGISPREALLMDPQQRLLMMYAWLAIEDAGYSASSLSGSNTGIFIGTGSTGYRTLLAKSNVTIEGYSSTGVVPSVGPNRMSYFLDVHGPSEPIETACSSSLVAIHRAVASIEAGECDQAIVGGVNTILTPEFHISFNKAGMLSPDGRCKTFSKDANGYVRGEGVGMLFLKPLDAAEAAGDHIYGVIRGSAENHGGRANSLTSPNSKAQADLLIKAYRKAGIDPRTVTYLEAHGTGTPLGDPIEINGIKTAFKKLYDETEDTGIRHPRCAIGSVKTNIGHLEFAAGVAGVIKVLLQFQHREIAPSLHCEELNPYIDFNGTPFFVASQGSRAWETLRDSQGNEIARRAGVSSFGYGGVNAHVVLEEYVPARPKPIAPTVQASPAMIPLSARNVECLRKYAQDLLAFVNEAPATLSLRDLAYTLQVGREAMEERVAVLAHSPKDLAEKLQAFVEGRGEIPDLYSGQTKRSKDVLAPIANDEELGVAMETWVKKGKYGKFLGLWSKGAEFDWERLYVSGERPNRISAPTYPFAPESYWIDTSPIVPVSDSAPVGDLGPIDDIDRLLDRIALETDTDAEPDLASEKDTVLDALEALGQGSVDLDQAIAAL